MVDSIRVNVELDSDSDSNDSDASKSTPSSPPSVEPRQCICCFKVTTTRRCPGCGFCPICSIECETFYNRVRDGAAGCCYHKVVDKLHKTSPLDHECLGDLRGGPMAIMGGTLYRYEPYRAIQALVQFVVDYLHLNEKIAPLTMHTHIAAALAPISMSDGKWSRGLLRVGHIPTHAAGTSKEEILADEYDVLARLLRFAGKLATTQNRGPNMGCPSTHANGMQGFVIARVVRIPKAAKASFDYGLQFDLVVANQVQDVNNTDLTCVRFGGGIRTAVAVYKLNGGLHEASGFPIFSFPGPTAEHHVLLSKASCQKLKPLLSTQKIRTALDVHS